MPSTAPHQAPGMHEWRMASPHTTQRRWQILRQQIDCGHEPCFSSDRRLECDETVSCPWSQECLALRAQWLR